MDGYLREKQRKLKDAYGMMALKCGVCAAPFLVLAILIGVMWLTEFSMAPYTWQERQVRFRRMGEVKELRGRSGRSRSPAMMTADGGAYVCGKTDAVILSERLRSGEKCDIVFVNGIDGYTHLRGLAVDGEVLIDRAAYERNWHELHRQTGAAVLVFMGLAAAAAGLGYILWARRDWDSVHRLRREIEIRRAKNAVREGKKLTRKGG